MKQEERIAQEIKEVVSSLMERVMNKVLVEDPFVPENHHAAKPLYAALVPDEIFKGAHFERRFVTPFGGVWEKLAVVVAREKHGTCEQGATIDGVIAKGRLQRIQEVLNQLEHRGSATSRRPDWDKELAYVLEGKGELIPCTVVCDLLVRSRASKKAYAFELEEPFQNKPRTKACKEKMFKLFAMQPQKVDCAYYALPNNPYIHKKDYAWSFPMRWFDMKNDTCVLVGDEFWDFIGSRGVYQIIINEINVLGKEYRDRICREYLDFEPHKRILKQSPVKMK